jgi:hypothetical protein
MATWPLPFEPNKQSYQETAPDNLIRDKNDTGPDNIRRRSRAAVRKLSLPYCLTPEQTDILDAFIQEELAGGALPFDFEWPPPPRATRTVSARLVSLPTYKHVGAGCYETTIEVEILP